MPSRKLTDRCPQCGSKNHLRARFCNQCGGRLDEDRATRDADGRAKLHADIAHPINSACREVIQSAVIRAFQEEKERSKQPGYISSYDEYDAGEYVEETFTQVVGELNNQRPPSAPGYRTHAPHNQRGGNHASPQETPVGTRATDPAGKGFGEGIL